VVVDGTVYVGTERKSARNGSVITTVEAVDASSGRLEWEYVATNGDGHRFFGRPTVLGDVVYVGDPSGAVHAIDRNEGTERWRVAEVIGSDTEPITVAGAPDSPLLAATRDELVAMDPDGGERYWSRPTGDDVSYRRRRTAVTGDLLLIAVGSEEEERLLAVETATGAVRWTVPLGDTVVRPLVVAGDVVYVVAERRLRGVSLSDGRELFVREFDNVITTPVVGPERVYVGVWETVYALEGSA